MPITSWRPHDESCLDVAIIGSGVGGLSIAFALRSIGILNYRLYDQSNEGCEGPWITYAKMKTLRSDKELVGPALNIPHLTFRAWYEAQHGEEGWRQLHKISTSTWMQYLCWFRQVLHFPVENSYKLVEIAPVGNRILLRFEQNGTAKEVLTRKVILATGRNGFGGCEIPLFAQGLPNMYCAHFSEMIDYTKLAGKNIAVIGVGASGWDAAGESLEQGAAQVDMLMRRTELPKDFSFADNYYPGYQIALNYLPDDIKIHFIQYYIENGVPPPDSSILRAEKFSNFRLISNIGITSAYIKGQKVIVQTTQGDKEYDFLILATGITVDASKQPELCRIADQILTWNDKVGFPSKLKHYPYLGPHYELQEKNAGEAPYLKNIHCFNWAALLSQGPTSIDILGFPIGAHRLAEGIAKDLFLQDWEMYFNIMITQ
jgi:cation diffusion facilitator CzcD-associated flavoprotein CzcO